MPAKSTSIKDISLKEDDIDDAFSVRVLDDEDEPKMRISPVNDLPERIEADDIPEPKDIIKVKFATFVQLVANRDMTEIFQRNDNEEIILSSNLLTEIASTSDKREEKKIPLVFLVGIAIGVVLTYIFFST